MDENEIEEFYKKYFPYEGMNRDFRDFILYIIGTSKEMTLEDNMYGNNKNPFYLYTLSMKKQDGIVLYHGIISNGEENKIIDGKILKLGDGYTQLLNQMNIYRLCEHLSDDKKSYGLVEKITFMKDKTTRNTFYTSGSIYNEEAYPYEPLDCENFIEGLTLNRKIK